MLECRGGELAISDKESREQVSHYGRYAKSARLKADHAAPTTIIFTTAQETFFTMWTSNMNRASGINNLAAGTIECGALLSTSLCFCRGNGIDKRRPMPFNRNPH